MEDPNAVRKFSVSLPDAALKDLKLRLAQTRWPEAATAPGWGQGVPLEHAQALCAYWRDSYDWRRCEAMLDGFGQFKSEIDGLGIYLLHKKSPEPGALPLLLTHGWPGSVIEFHKVIGLLTDPVAHGGRAEDAFHVVAPSLPGYGFSDKPSAPGWNLDRIAAAWATLMERLGYDRYVAQGGDWGSGVTTALARRGTPGLAAINLNMVMAFPSPDEELTESEKRSKAHWELFQSRGSAYARQQSTRPQTLGYGLADSPIGQACWIYEKFHEWADCGGDPLSILTADEILDNISLYWFTNTGASSARLYWESIDSFAADPLDLPVACSVFPGEIIVPSRRWAERKYPNLIHFNELPKGGHFAAFEQPELFVQEMRDSFRSLR